MNSEETKSLNSEWVQFEVRDAIAVVRLNRADKKNALSISMLKKLRGIAVHLQGNCDVKAVVLTGNGTAFSAGADVKDPERWEIAPQDLGAQRMVAQLGPRLCREWEALPQPTIAAIEGFAVGGAAGLALCCDFRVCSEQAFFQFPEVRMGLPMGWQTVPRLVAVCGAARTKHMLLIGERIEAGLALEWGLVTQTTPAGTSMEVAQLLASKLAEFPPHSVAMIKEAVNNAAGLLGNSISIMDVDQVNWAASAGRSLQS